MKAAAVTSFTEPPELGDVLSGTIPARAASEI